MNMFKQVKISTAMYNDESLCVLEARHHAPVAIHIETAKAFVEACTAAFGQQCGKPHCFLHEIEIRKGIKIWAGTSQNGLTFQVFIKFLTVSYELPLRDIQEAIQEAESLQEF